MLQRLLRILKKDKKLALGRWSVSDNKIEQNRKIDLANCDSCGVCNNTIDDIIKLELAILPNHSQVYKKENET